MSSSEEFFKEMRQEQRERALRWEEKSLHAEEKARFDKESLQKS